MLRFLVSNNPKKWDQVLPQVQFVMNSIVNKTTGVTPFFVIYTKQPNSIVDLSHLPCMPSKATSVWVKD